MVIKYKNMGVKSVFYIDGGVNVNADWDVV